MSDEIEYDESDTHWTSNPRPDELDPPPAEAIESGSDDPDCGGMLGWPTPEDRQRNWRESALSKAIQVYEKLGPLPIMVGGTSRAEEREVFVAAQVKVVKKLYAEFYKLLDPKGDGS